MPKTVKTIPADEPGQNSIVFFGINQSPQEGESISVTGNQAGLLSSEITFFISSDDNSDDATIRIVYLSGNLEKKFVEAQVNGVAFVDLVIDAIFIQSAEIISGVPTGTIYISSDNTDGNNNGVPDDADDIIMIIEAEDMKALEGIYVVPANRIAHIHGWSGSMDGSSGARILLELVAIRRDLPPELLLAPVFLSGSSTSLFDNILPFSLKPLSAGTIVLANIEFQMSNPVVSGQMYVREEKAS